MNSGTKILETSDSVFNEIVLKTARTYLGVKYRHQGRTRDAGLDCSGLVIKVGHDVGATRFDLTDYKRKPTGTQFTDNFYKECRFIPHDEMIPGDILVFMDDHYPCHCGFYSGNGKMIHAYIIRKKVVEEPFTETWRKKLCGVFRYENRGL